MIIMVDKMFLTKQSECLEHSFTDLVRFWNGRSAWGDKICQKCGETYSWQYDFPNITTAEECKPY